MALRERRSRRRGRSGVVRLNQGSSPYGVRNTLPLNMPGGSFGSGRTAGGGAGAGTTLAQALMAPAMSVMGPQASIGPPPVEQAPPAFMAEEQHPYDSPYLPTFTPRPVTFGGLGGFAPTFSPYIDPRRRAY